MTQSDQAAFLISLQERSNKVWDDLRLERDIDREKMSLLEDRVTKLEQVGAEVKKHTKTDIGSVVQNPTVLIAILALVAVLSMANVDFNNVFSRFFDWLGK